MLDLALASGIVRISVAAPEGLHAEVEELLERRYALREAHVFDVSTGGVDDERDLVDSLGQLLATRLQSQRLAADVVGFTSWSRSLRATVAALEPAPVSIGCVVEMLGDVGPVTVQHEAAEATRHFAEMTGAQPRDSSGHRVSCGTPRC